MSRTDLNPLNYPFRSMTDFSDELYRQRFGRELEAVPVGIGPTGDVIVQGDRVYALAESSLIVLDAGSLEIIGRLDGLVSARQVAADGGIAVVTARESGVYIVDISDPARPVLAAHYDPVEFATGVHLARPGLAILTCRHYGLEFVDLSNPAAPRFVSSILVGEAQSVTSVGTLAYAGVWFEKELVVVDFSDPAHPFIKGRSDLDGFGDGVLVRGGHAYVATGHHSGLQRDPRNFEPARHVTLDMLEAGYGRGHGVEVHDVSEPENPRLAARFKSPPSFINSPDTWRLALHGDLLVQADAENGVFVYDVSDPASLVPLAFAVLPPFATHRQLRSQSIQEDRHPATGIAIAGNTLLVASKTSDLYRCALPAIDDVSREAPRPGSPYLSQYPAPDTAQEAGQNGILETDGQVHWVASDGEVIYAAAGTDGLYMLDPVSGGVLARQPLAGIVQHVFCAGGLVYASQGTGGLTIFERDGTVLREAGFWHDGPSVRQVMVDPSLPLGIAVVAGGEFAILDIADPAAPARIATHRVLGLVYARLLADRVVEGRYAICASQGAGLNWFDLSDASGAARQPISSDARLCPIAEGITVHRDRALVLQAGGYYAAAADRPVRHGDARHIREPGRYFSGNPQSLGPDRIVVTNRATGSARVLDVTDIEAPRTLAYYKLPGNPDRPIRAGEHIVFPCGRGGLQRVHCP